MAGPKTRLFLLNPFVFPLLFCFNPHLLVVCLVLFAFFGRLFTWPIFRGSSVCTHFGDSVCNEKPVLKCLSFFSFQGAVGVVSLIRFLLCPLQSIHLLSLTAVRVGLLFKLLTLSSDRHLLSRSVPLGHNRRSLVPPRGSQGSQRFPYSFCWPPLLFSKMGPPLLSKMGPPLLSKMGPPLLSKMEAAIAIQDGAAIAIQDGLAIVRPCLFFQ